MYAPTVLQTLLLALAAISSVAASPIDVDSIATVEDSLVTKRGNCLGKPCPPSPRPGTPAARPAALVAPTAEECAGHINMGPALFWSGQGNFNQYSQDALKRSYLHGYKVLNQMFKDHAYMTKYDSSTDAAVKQAFWENCSKALALGQTGTAYVLLPALGHGEAVTHWFQQSIWARIEYPNLKHATKLIRINPTDEHWQEEVPLHH
jgi:hypothetical protein